MFFVFESFCRISYKNFFVHKKSGRLLPDDLNTTITWWAQGWYWTGLIYVWCNEITLTAGVWYVSYFSEVTIHYGKAYSKSHSSHLIYPTINLHDNKSKYKSCQIVRYIFAAKSWNWDRWNSLKSSISCF